MDIITVEDQISKDELKKLAKIFYVSMIKGVVDIKKEIVAFGGEYHIDANTVLIENGSSQNDLWGFNVVFNKPRENWIEYISLINIRPHAGNHKMEVQDQKIRDIMKSIVNSKII